MKSINIKPLHTLTLKRSLYGQKEPVNLFPYDAADEYLLETLQQSEYQNLEGPVLIFNDGFGALSTALSLFKPYHVSDSFVSQLALRQNLRINQIDEAQVVLLESLAALPIAPSLILLKIPKSLSLLSFQLQQIKAIMTDSTRIIAGAKAQDIHTSTLKLFEDIGDTKTSLAKKKARLVFCKPRITQTQPLHQEAWAIKQDAGSASLTEQHTDVNNLNAIVHPIHEATQSVTPVLSTWRLDDHTLVSNYPNVFSRGQLDIGARFFLEHLPENKQGTLIDLGCGNGVIGLSLLRRNPEAKIIFADESYMAIASSRLNVLNNQPDAMHRVEFLISDALHQFPKDSVDMILCNPPFHQQNTLTNHIAKAMFSNAMKSLKVGGQLIIVGNRHLNYFHQLKGLFGNCVNLASNNKFFILASTKK